MYVADRDREGTVLGEVTPRSYLVQTPEGTFRRNRRQIIQSPQSNTTTDSPQPTSDSDSVDEQMTDLSTEEKEYSTRLRSGKSVRPPKRFGSTLEKGRCSDR